MLDSSATQVSTLLYKQKIFYSFCGTCLSFFRIKRYNVLTSDRSTGASMNIAYWQIFWDRPY